MLFALLHGWAPVFDCFSEVDLSLVEKVDSEEQAMAEVIVFVTKSNQEYFFLNILGKGTILKDPSSISFL